MIVDSSALIGILKDEADAAELRQALSGSDNKVSVANWFEACLVAEHYASAGAEAFDVMVAAAEVEIVPVTVEHGRLAREAHRRFGRGSGSPARLNFGDCFAYALAVSTGEPLLFTGDDFAHTDVRSALG